MAAYNVQSGTLSTVSQSAKDKPPAPKAAVSHVDEGLYQYNFDQDFTTSCVRCSNGTFVVFWFGYARGGSKSFGTIFLIRLRNQAVVSQLIFWYNSIKFIPKSGVYNMKYEI